MPVRKRTPGLDADYYVSGAAVRRNARQQDRDSVTRRAPARRQEAAFMRNDLYTQRRHAEPTRDMRSRQERRRAEPPRAYYASEPSTQRLTRAEVNHRTVQQHAWQRAEQERLQREAEVRRQAEEAAEQQRRRQQRVHTLFAFLMIAAVVLVIGGVYSLLLRYTKIEQMTVTQRQLTAQVEDQQKRLEELQVEINKQGNISQVQDYARENLNMDYAQKDNTRVITLP